jgi:hypothetical protein
MTDGPSRNNENQPIYPRPSCKTMPRRNASWKPMLRQSACASRPPALLMVDRSWPGQGGGLSPGSIIALAFVVGILGAGWLETSHRKTTKPTKQPSLVRS